MSELHVQVREISEVKIHPGADRLDLAIVGGWQCIVGRGQYKAGDKCIYFPPDTIIPQELSDRLNVTQYLSKGRIRCARLRGEPSFGLVVTPDQDWAVGTDVAEHYGAKKYEPPVKALGEQQERDHELFVKYTSIENMRNYVKTFVPGEIVSCTEKVHGCLVNNTKVSMADGSRKNITKIKVGEFVLGVNDDGKVLPTAVLNVYNNGKAAQGWLTIKGKRRGGGRGNHLWSLHCTPNHQVFSPDSNSYIDASLLKVGQRVMLLHCELDLSQIQTQVLIGKMLGDGHFHQNGNEGALIYWSHSEKQAEYVEWTAMALGDIVGSVRKFMVSGYGSNMIRAYTLSMVCIRDKFSNWFRDGVKCIPSWVADEIGPIGFAFWYMDDGHLEHCNGASFAVCAYDDASVGVLIKALKRFGISSVSYFSEEKYPYIRLNLNDADKFFLLIAPYIPPSMQYKLPERYRGHSGWIPKTDNQYKPPMIEQFIDTVDRYDPGRNQSQRYDIETETHNFFANGILVHNSNSRVGIVRDTEMAGSHKLRRKDSRDEDKDWYGYGTYWYPWSLEPVQQLLRSLGEIYDQAILFGEIFGPGIQNFTYGRKGLDYLAFDLMIDSKYLDVDDFKETCARYGVPTVPELARIPFDIDAIAALSKGKTVVGNGAHIREGVVVKPLHERVDPRVGRVALKYVSDDYLLGLKEDFTDV